MVKPEQTGKVEEEDIVDEAGTEQKRVIEDFVQNSARTCRLWSGSDITVDRCFYGVCESICRGFIQ